MLYKDKSGKEIEGYIEFKPKDRPGSVFINWLANKHSSVGSPMIREMQRKFSKITLMPVDENADKFYEHMGFRRVGRMEMEWSKKQKIKFK